MVKYGMEKYSACELFFYPGVQKLKKFPKNST